MIATVETPTLSIGYHDTGPRDGPVAILLHGFPYDVHCYDAVAPRLNQAGLRVLVPWLRGYGPTRFRNAGSLRSGQQAALAHDLLEFMDALAIERATLAGYDWGGRAACIVAALWPERVHGLVSCLGYNVQDIAGAAYPATPEAEHRYWYQYYLHGERGVRGLAVHREAFCRLLWRQWSPSWRFDDDEFLRSAAAFRNPDFDAVVVHSYRHRYGLVAGDPAYEHTERALAELPPIRVPTIALDGADDGVGPVGGSASHAGHFVGGWQHRTLAGVGHNPPREAPGPFAQAVLELR
ncbi:MAG: alpha/beta hydrolase [Burkholderiaceae bacterium]